MPPVMMTRVMPSVAMATKEKLRTTFLTLPSVRKCGDSMLMMMMSTTSATST